MAILWTWRPDAGVGVNAQAPNAPPHCPYSFLTSHNTQWIHLPPQRSFCPSPILLWCAITSPRSVALAQIPQNIQSQAVVAVKCARDIAAPWLGEGMDILRYNCPLHCWKPTNQHITGHVNLSTQLKMLRYRTQAPSIGPPTCWWVGQGPGLRKGFRVEWFYLICCYFSF